MSRAKVIADEGGMIFGVVVRIKPEDTGQIAITMALDALMDADGITIEEARNMMAGMRSTVQQCRWVPRRDSSGIRPYIEDAEAGSRGSWLGIYWSYP